jgi:protein gp37
MWGCGGVSYQWFPEALDKLLTKRPRFWFLNSKSDLFDERAGFADLAALFDRIAETPWHRYMILTKEVGRLSAFLGAYENEGRFNWPSNFGHVILMTSIEGAAQMTRWDHLAAIPAVHRGISFEPLLGPVAHELVKRLQESQTPAADIDWIVIGCEKLLGGRAGRWAGEEPDAWWGVTALIVNAAVKADVRVWMKQGPNLTHFAPPGPIKVTAALADFPPHCQIQQRPWGDWP